MDLRILRYFLAVAKEGNISHASAVLHVTQPSLSRQLKDLEDELGVTLFTRSNRNIVLTQEGKYLAKRGRELVDFADRIERVVKRSSREVVTGEVAIGSIEGADSRMIARCIARFRAKYPQVIFHMMTDDDLCFRDKLNRGLVDFAIMPRVFALDSECDYLELRHEDSWGVLMRDDAPHVGRPSLSLNELKGIPIILPRQAYEQGQLGIDLPCSAEDLKVASTYALVGNAALMVREGVGYALCFMDAFPSYRDCGLSLVPLDSCEPVTMGLFWKKSQMPSRAVELFLEEFRTLLVEDALEDTA